MKQLIIFFSSISLLFSCGLLTKNKAIEYNNSLIKEQERVAAAINEFIELVTTSDTLSHSLIEIKRKEVIATIDQSIHKVNEIGSFKNSDDFQQSILNVMKAYKSGVENEYSEMATYMTQPIEKQFSEQYFEKQKNTFKADSMISVAEADFIEAQQKFAAKHDFDLSPVPYSNY